MLRRLGHALGPSQPTRRRAIEIEPIGLEEQETAAIRRRVDPDELPSWVAATQGLIAIHLQSIGVATTDVPYLRVHELGASPEIEVGYPVAERITPKDEVVPATLPGGPAVMVRKTGGFDALAEGLEAVDAWMQQRGVEPADAPWVIGHTGPSSGFAAAPEILDIHQTYRD